MIDARRLIAPLFFALLILGFSPCIVQGAQDGQTVSDAFPNLSSGSLSSAKLAALPKGVLLQSGKLVLKQRDLDAEIRKNPKDIWPQLKRSLFFVLENTATRALLAEEAKAWAKTKGRGAAGDQNRLIGDYLKDLTAVITATDAEAKGFYDTNKSMFGETTFDQAKDQICDYLINEKRGELVNSRVNTLSERTAVVVDTAWTTKQYAAAMDNPVDKARMSGQPLMVDFGADGCRPCEMMTPVLDSLTKKYTGKLQVLFVHVKKEPILGARYGVSSIPVQVFFDKSGAEFFRHVGFFPQDQIEAKLAEMGVK